MNSSPEIEKVCSISGHHAAIYALCEGWDADTVISGSGDKYIAQWNILTGQQEKFSAILPSPVFSLAYLSEFKQLWVGTANGHVHVLDIKHKKEIHDFYFHERFVYDLTFDKNTNKVYSVAADGCINIYDPESLKHLHRQKFSNHKLRSALVTEDKIFLAEGSGKSIVLNSNDLTISASFQSHQFATNCYCIDTKNNRLYSGGRDAHIKLWAVQNEYELIQSIPAHNFAIYRLLEIPDSEYIVSASRDKTIKLWQKDHLTPVSRISKENFNGHTHSVNALIWHRQRNKLISAGDDRQIIVWDLSFIK